MDQTGYREDRPWGCFEILADAATHKVKRITVHPAKRLSDQRHAFRSEHWYIVAGEGIVTRDGQEIPVRSGNAVDLPVRAWHRIKNTGAAPLVFIEVQTGTSFAEDDIERRDDDYGRVKA